MATKAPAKKAAAKTPAKKAPAKKAAAASADGNTDATAAAAATVTKVEPRDDLSKAVPPVTTHEALNAINHEDREQPETEVKHVVFLSVHQTDPNRRIPGTNPYLDDLERERAEIVRAKVEDREPDLENPPAVQGTPLAQKEQFIAQSAGYANTEGVPTITLGVTVVKD
jgi:hypothetical protein